VDKYHLPWSHDAFQQLTVLELLTDFWEDYYRRNPVETRRTESGDVVYANTGDPLIDKWEQEIARGLVPDLYEGIPQKKKDRKRQEDSLKEQQRAMLLAREISAEGFSDDYGDRRKANR